ncbi:MAG: DegT/DnrJ/EryC1/StrS family aminotransferase [Candidatus Methylomirabilales bacterium]
MTKFRLVPPAGAPLPARAVLSSLYPASNSQSSLEKLLRQRLRAPHVFPISSGRAALTIILRVLQKLCSRREVVIPAYTCFSVPSAVVRAGLSIRLCDVDPKALDLDYTVLTRLDLDKVLCIVPSSLYGMPSDLFGLEEIARAAGVYLIDDAAQCLGATLAGKACGTFGDAGFYSLGRGKNITTMGGGILITQKDDLADLIQKELKKLPRPSSFSVLSATLNSVLYAGMLSPSRYWLLDPIPFLGLGVSVFDPNFRMTQLSPYQERLASRLWTLVHPYNRVRCENARLLCAGLDGVEGIEIPQLVEGATPVYLRFPILARDGMHRSRLLSRLKDAGIGASTSYPTAIGDIPGIEQYLGAAQQDCPGARSIAERIITLPTHPYVTASDVDRMIEIVRAES